MFQMHFLIRPVLSAVYLYAWNYFISKSKETISDGEAHLVGKSLSVEVNSVHVHFVAHAEEVPVNFLLLCHNQSMEITIQLAINPFNRHSQRLPHTYTKTHRITQ